MIFTILMNATEITRQQAYNSAIRTNGSSQQTSTINDITVTFNYMTLTAQNFNNLSTYSLYEQSYNTGVWSGIFGNYYAYQSTTIGWSDQSQGAYSSIQGYKLLPVEGKSTLSMSGLIDTNFFNSRPLTEISTLEWKIIYARTGSFSDAEILDAGSFQVKRFANGENKTEFISGDNTVDNLVVHDFTQGYISFLVKNTYTNAGANGGHVNIMDGFTYNFTTTVPEINSILFFILGIALVKLFKQS